MRRGSAAVEILAVSRSSFGLRFGVRRCSGALYWLEERPSEIFGWLPGLSGGYGSMLFPFGRQSALKVSNCRASLKPPGKYLQVVDPRKLLPASFALAGD